VTQSKQTVDGFGFSTAWGSVPSTANMDAFLSTTKGAGLSIIRNRIPFRERPGLSDNFMGSGNYNYTTTGTGSEAYKTFTLNWGTWDLSATKRLIATINANPDYQVASYFSTPWTPPNNSTSMWKLGVADYTNKPDVGGYLDPAHYQDYADVLADYALGFQANMGAPLAALSLQNEPNYKCDYESADWSSSQIRDFMTVLKTEFTKKGVFTQLPKLTIIAPEHNTMSEALVVPTLDDSSLSSLVGIVAGHQYEYGWSSNPLSLPAPKLTTAQSAGKRLWMTEWSVERFLTATGTTYTNNDIYPSLALAKAIHTNFATYGLNAYVYWWSSALVNNGSPAKVLWTLAQYSRFVRPGWIRVDTSAAPTSNVLLSAFVNSTKDHIAVIAVNMEASSESFVLSLDTGTFGTITPYRTSVSENLVMLETIAGGTNAVQVTVPAQSITTFTSSI
jgi:O-glycosyl hydrolase